MTTVITYGTYDMIHYGHIRLLERAKALGDYLIVGVTSDDYDVSRGKINVQQSLSERLKGVRDTGIADEIIVEEYEGQKIDDIRTYGVDIFAIGSDWYGKFDYLNEYCKVVYLDRTKGVSSSEIRSKNNAVRMGFIGDADQIEFTKYYNEAKMVNGAEIIGVFLDDVMSEGTCADDDVEKRRTNENCNRKKEYDHYRLFDSITEILDNCDAVYIASHPKYRYQHIKEALLRGRHVLCKSPIALAPDECRELYKLARDKGVILMDAIKTAYSTAYNRLLLLAKSGRIGDILTIDSTCTSLSSDTQILNSQRHWNSIDMWGPVAMLPVLQILGTNYEHIRYISSKDQRNADIDAFTNIQFVYKKACASVKVGKGIKSESELIISGTKGYIYVPAPWWKTDYFEIRYENPAENRRYFYQLEGEGIRFELVAFIRKIHGSIRNAYLDENISCCISDTVYQYYKGDKTIYLR